MPFTPRSAISAIGIAMGDDGDKKTNSRGWLMELLLEEVAAQNKTPRGPQPFSIEHEGRVVHLSSDGEIHLGGKASAEREFEEGVELLGAWAREEADALIDAFMDSTLAHRFLIVERLLDAACEATAGMQENITDVLRFIDDGLALDGASAELSAKIHETLLRLAQ